MSFGDSPPLGFQPPHVRSYRVPRYENRTACFSSIFRTGASLPPSHSSNSSKHACGRSPKFCLGAWGLGLSVFGSV